jgi:hypothetical protein
MIPAVAKNNRTNASRMNHVLPLTHQLQGRMRELVDHLQAAALTVAEPKARAMFENSATVLADLVRTFDDYEKKDEAAWNKHWGLSHQKPQFQGTAFLKHFGPEILQ